MSFFFRNPRAALIYAAGKGEVDMIETLLDKGVNVNSKDKGGITPLMNAAATGHYGIVNLLLKRGANANERNKEGVTALMLAALNGNTACIRALLHRCENINAKDNCGRTALKYAADQAQYSAIELLLANGAEAERFNIKKPGEDMNSEQKQVQAWVQKWIYQESSGRKS